MRWLIFLSRVAFLCGVFMILGISLLLYPWNRDEKMSSVIISSGYTLSLFMVPLVNVLYIVTALAGKKPQHVTPKWLFFSNIIFLILLIVFVFYINDPYYHQG